MMGLDDEGKLKSSIRTSTDCGLESWLAESTLEGLRRLFHERKREARIQLEESLEKQQQAQTRRGGRRDKATTATRRGGETRRQQQQEEAAEETRRQQQRGREEEAMGEAEQQGREIRVTEEQQHTRRRSEVTKEMRRQISQEKSKSASAGTWGKTFGDVHKQDRQYCEWVARQETTNVHMIRCT